MGMVPIPEASYSLLCELSWAISAWLAVLCDTMKINN